MRIERGPDPGPFTKPTDYKAHLRPVFRERCAYCLTPDFRNGGVDGMTVDHFQPVTRYPQLRLAWSNLYYSCSPCNSHHKKDHPTEEEEAAGCGLVDPCDQDPNDHFRMTRDPNTQAICRIRPLTDAAKYTLRILRFNSRRSLRDFWREIDRLECSEVSRIHEIREMLQQLRLEIERRGRSEEMSAVQGDYVTQLQRCETKLANIRSMRPFPLDPEVHAGEDDAACRPGSAG